MCVYPQLLRKMVINTFFLMKITFKWLKTSQKMESIMNINNLKHKIQTRTNLANSRSTWITGISFFWKKNAKYYGKIMYISGKPVCLCDRFILWQFCDINGKRKQNKNTRINKKDICMYSWSHCKIRNMLRIYQYINIREIDANN